MKSIMRLSTYISLHKTEAEECTCSVLASIAYIIFRVIQEIRAPEILSHYISISGIKGFDNQINY